MIQPRLFADVPPPEIEVAHLIPNRALWQRRVYELARSRDLYGVTADEAAAFYDVGHNTVAPRISELQEEGWLYKTKDRRKTRSGCWARVLVAKAGRPNANAQ